MRIILNSWSWYPLWKLNYWSWYLLWKLNSWSWYLLWKLNSWSWYPLWKLNSWSWDPLWKLINLSFDYPRYPREINLIFQMTKDLCNFLNQLLTTQKFWPQLAKIWGLENCGFMQWWQCLIYNRRTLKSWSDQVCIL